MANINSDDKQEKRFIDPETGAPDGTSSSGGITGSGGEAGNQTKSKPNGGEKASTSAVDTGHSEPGGNIGGRGPGTASKTIGDQDSTQGRNDMDTVDPMTSRAPSQLDKVKPQDNSKDELARRDP